MPLPVVARFDPTWFHPTIGRDAAAPSVQVKASANPDGLDVFAYGSMRGGALGGPDRDVPLGETSGVETLYSSGARLIHAETWLRREALKARASSLARSFFNAVLVTLGSLLPGDEKVEVVGDEILISAPTGLKVPLSAMSDGYLTTLGWTIDLIARWAHRYRDSGKLDGDFAKDMRCVVLVDEIDLHLHPRWQLDIIPRLRKAFPKTTFIVTTHNPLTLQGTRPGEVFVLQRDDDGKVTLAQRDVPPGIDASRLLTGDWFGLASTLDEDTLQAMDEHRKLLWKGAPESDPRRRALEAKLRERLGRFADTSLERLAQSVAVEILHRDSPARPRDVTEAQRDEIIKKVEERLTSRAGGTSIARESAAPYGVPRKVKATAKRAATAKQRRPAPSKRR